MTPKLWLVAGPNGAGKSTIVQLASLQRVLPGVEFWNPDSIALNLLQANGASGFADTSIEEQRRAFIQAANIVSVMIEDRISACIPFGVETVLSSDKYKPLVEKVLSAQGFFGLIYVWLNSSQLACQRVAQRVLEGGHDVPQDKVHSRWHRSLANIPWFASRASQFFIFDNSDSDPDIAPLLVAYGTQGKLRMLTDGAAAEITSALTGLS